jgi:nucleotide-binding universal stress UspA family protein
VTPTLEPPPDIAFRRLLVVLEERAGLGPLLEAVAAAARRHHAAVTLMVITADCSDVMGSGTSWVSWTPDVGALQRSADAYSQALIREAVCQIPVDIPVTTVIRRGDKCRAIVAQARASNSDVVMLGPDRATRWWRRPSLAVRVARYGDIAVMTCPGQTVRRTHPQRRTWTTRVPASAA